MRTRRKELIKRTAKELNMSISDVDEIICAYYGEVRSLMQGLSDLHIMLPYLGTFSIRRNKLEVKAEYYRGLLENMKDDDVESFKEKMYIKTELEKCERLIELREEEIKNQKEHYAKHKKKSN